MVPSRKRDRERWWRSYRWHPRFQNRSCWRCANDLLSGERHTCADCVRIGRRQREAVKDGRLVAAKHDPYTLEEIATRDGFRCQICVARGQWRKAKIDMNLKVPHLRAATIDHVLAIAHGGEDTRANVQLAHFGCNAWKQAGRLNQQLAMFG
jgi:hypothetical protein